MELSPDQISYQNESDLSVEAFLEVLHRSSLAARRPVSNPKKIAGMVKNADLMITARGPDGALLGLARSITDFHYALYCSELCVVAEAQGLGIGKALLKATEAEAPECHAYLLLSAPKAVTFYEAAGYERHENCFLFHSQ